MNALDQLKKANPEFLSEYDEPEKKELNVPEEIQRLWNHFKRYVEINDRRVANLQKELETKKTELTNVKEFVDKLKDKQVVQETREQVHMMNTQANKPSEVPIDRNGVAPSSVRLDKIFYTGR